MKITNIDVISSSLTDLINLSFRDPTSQNSYIAKAIVGLDADEISSKFYGVGNVTNNKYYSMSMAKRTLVISILLNPKYELGETPSTLRDALYKGISSSRTGALTLKFKDGTNTVAVIQGFLAKVEATHFSNTPEIQLTVECIDPMFTSPDFVDVNVGSIQDILAPNIIDNVSTAPHGFLFSALINQPIGSFSISDASTPEWSFKIVYPFLTDDQLYFSSVNNKRYVYILRENSTIHLVDKILTNSIWPVLFPGENKFVITTTANYNLEYITWEYISHKHTYWGI
jgi:hypothetical protein